MPLDWRRIRAGPLEGGIRASVRRLCSGHAFGITPEAICLCCRAEASLDHLGAVVRFKNFEPSLVHLHHPSETLHKQGYATSYSQARAARFCNVLHVGHRGEGETFSFSAWLEQVTAHTFDIGDTAHP